MNDIVFCKNFLFNEFCFQESRHRDNSQGVGFHFIGFMKNGTGRLVTRDQVLDVEENDMFYIPKGCQYHSYWTPKGSIRFDSIGFLYFPTAAANGYKLQKIPYNDAIWQAFAPLSQDKTVNAASIGMLYRLLGLLETSLAPATNKGDAAIYEKLVLLMKENPQLTVPEYAALCGVSESLLYNYVKRCSGKTPNRLRQEILCQKAAELLFTTSYTIEQICDRLNFSSAAYFRSVFKSVYQKSPSQMRKEENMI